MSTPREKRAEEETSQNVTNVQTEYLKSVSEVSQDLKKRLDACRLHTTTNIQGILLSKLISVSFSLKVMSSFL